MTKTKLVVSLDETLFAQIEDLALEMKISQSHLVALALEDFIRRSQNRRLLDQINAAYDELPETEEEKAVIRGMRRLYRRVIEGQES